MMRKLSYPEFKKWLQKLERDILNHPEYAEKGFYGLSGASGAEDVIIHTLAVIRGFLYGFPAPGQSADFFIRIGKPIGEPVWNEIQFGDWPEGTVLMPWESETIEEDQDLFNEAEDAPTAEKPKRTRRKAKPSGETDLRSDLSEPETEPELGD